MDRLRGMNLRMEKGGAREREISCIHNVDGIGEPIEIYMAAACCEDRGIVCTTLGNSSVLNMASVAAWGTSSIRVWKGPETEAASSSDGKE